MRFKKASLVAAALALSSSILCAADLNWNGGQTGYQVVYVNGLPFVKDANGNLVSTAIPTGGFTAAGGSGVIDSTTANWLDFSGTAQSLTSAGAGQSSSNFLNFDGVGGVVLVKSGATAGYWNFDVGGYEVLPDNGSANSPLNFTNINLAAGAGTLTLHDAFGVNSTISGNTTQRYMPGDTIVFVADTSGVISQLSGNVNFVKNGPGLLQIAPPSNTSADLIGGGIFYYGQNNPNPTHIINTYTPGVAGGVNYTYTLAPTADAIWDALFPGVTPPTNLVGTPPAGSTTTLTGGGTSSGGGLSGIGAGGGSITVNQGILQVSGYINAWSQNSASQNGINSGQDSFFQVASMTGASKVVLNGTAELNFTNTLLNVATGLHPDLNVGGGSLVETKRYNFVNNLQAGLNNDQLNTRLFTGLDNTYRIDINIDAAPIEGTKLVTVGSTTTVYLTQTYDTNANRAAVQGSIGIIAGAGDVYKTGLGQFTILNDAETGTGNFFAAGGVTVLASATGNSVANMASFNLTGTSAGSLSQTPSQVGFVAAYRDVQVSPNSPTRYFKQQFFPSPDNATVSLLSNQTISNLQADFAFGAAPDASNPTLASAIANAYNTSYRDEPMIASTGAGSVIDLGGHTLTINQVRDGVYEGSIIDGGSGGAVVKTGTGKLVLSLSAAGDYGLLHVMQGSLYANAQSLGTGVVQVDSGATLGILQTNTGTLLATIDTTPNTPLDIGSQTTVDNGSGTLINVNSNNNAGILLVGTVESGITGDILVHDGVTLQLSSAAPDAIANARSVQLSGGASARETVLSVSDSVQNINNLIGDSLSRLDLGRGAAIIHQTLSGGTFAGQITGVGTLVKDGGADLTLSSANSTYFGATVVKGGTLYVTGVNGLARTSGAVLTGGGIMDISGQNETIGALFGSAGTLVRLGAGTLTIGTSDARTQVLFSELQGGAPLIGDYLGTQDTAVINGQTFTGSQFDASLVASTTVAGSTLTGVALNTAKFLKLFGMSDAEANALAFAGSITGSGGLIKIGTETLILSGTNPYTGATAVQGGVLQVNFNSIGATSGVAVSAGATLAINADATTGDGTFDRTVTGAGTVSKIGANTVQVAGNQFSGFTGVLNAHQGTLQMNGIGGFAGSAVIDSTGTLTFNQGVDASSAITVANAGVLIKTGTGALTFTGTPSYTGAGAIDVQQGTLDLSSLPVFPAALNVATGATFVGTISGVLNSSTAVTTSGTGATPGTVRLMGSGGAPTLLAGAPDLFKPVALDLRGVTFDLGGTSQQLGGFTGDAASSIALSNGTLVFAPASGVNSTFGGTVTGSGSLVKNGAGEIALSSTLATGWSGTVTVNAGTLDATPESLGVSVVHVLGGTFSLRNDNTASAVDYGNVTTIAAGATLAKTGLGEVVLASGVTGFAGANIAVNQGRLTTADGGTDAVFTGVTVASGATYRVNMTGDRLHDSSTAEKVVGAGSLAVSGAHTLTLAGTQSYTGNTELLNGANLAFGAGVTSVNGLAGDSTSTVTMPGDLTVNQSQAGSFSGQFIGGPGALTVTGTGVFGIAGDLTAQTGLSSVTVSGGTLQVDSVNTKAVSVVSGGTLDISNTAGTHDSHDQYAGVVTGTGNVNIVGGGYIFINDPSAGTPFHLLNTGTTTVSSGTLGGDFSTSGALVIAGGTLAPGNSPGTVTVNGSFTLASNGTLAVEMNATTSDKVVVNGAASVAGVLKVTQDDTPGSAKAAGGQTFTIISATGGVTGAFSNASANGVVTLDTADQAASGISRVQLTTVGSDLRMRTLTSIRDLIGFAPHDGVGGLVSVLDGQFLSGTGSGPLQDMFNAQIGSANFSGTVNNLSPLGYASEYAMAQDGDNRRVSLLHDRLEQRRYDRGSPLTSEDAPWEAFAIGDASFASNKTASNTPDFDYNTYGGIVGLDRKIGDELVLGAAAAYDNGTATIQGGGGTVDMNRATVTGFAGGQLTKRWYFDLGATAGYGSYDSKRYTGLGEVKGSNDGFSGGLNAETGTIFVLTENLHLTPYVGASYTHYEFDGFTEKGVDSRLKISGWSQDSLRTKLGSGLGWFVPMEWCKLKIGLDVAYAHEFLDTSGSIDARFVAAGPHFGTTAAAIPEDSVSATPSLGFEFNESTSATFSYSYEMGFDGRSYQSINLALRKRF